MKTAELVIKNGRILNPASGTDAVGDIYIAEGRIIGICTAEDKDPGCRDIAENKDPDCRVIDAEGKFVFPGFIDLHVHFRDPGQTQKEDIAGGSAAAAAGGYTSVVAMPNTSPVADSPEIIEYVSKKAAQVGLVNVFQTGSVTLSMAGKEVSPIEDMVAAGAKAISEDGKSVMDSNVYREAMKIAARLDIPVLAHCEDINLVNGGVMNLGKKSAELGVSGISNAVENIIEARDIMLAEETGARLHLCHCSTKESVELVRDGKAKGIRVTGEVCPHHFTLCEEDIPADADDVTLGNFKMNPPLRTREDREALKCALRDGILDCISTDHAPHTPEEKAKGMKGPFGIIGIETAAALTYTELVLGGYLTPMGMAEKMSFHPAKILGIDRGDISVDKVADLTIFDPTATYEIHAADFHGKARNMPYEGRKVTGKVTMTIHDGRITYQA